MKATKCGCSGYRFRWFRITALSFALLLSCQSRGSDITLEWNPSVTPNVTYRLYRADLIGAWAVTLEGLTNLWASVPAGTTASRFYIGVVGTNGTESVPSNIATNYVNPPPVTTNLTFQAEDGVLNLPFYVNGTVIQQDVQTDAASGGRASWTFNITAAGPYLVKAMVNAPDEGANSFYVNMDYTPVEANTWDIPVTSGLQERVVTWKGETGTHSFALSTGQHTLIIRGREADTQLDQVSIVPASVTPPPNPQPQPPKTPTNVRLTFPTNRRVDIGWTSDLNYPTEVWRSLDTDPFKRLAVVASGVMHYTDTKRAKKVRYQVRSCGANVGCSDYSAVIGYGP